MNYKQIIVDSWVATQNTKKLIWWFGFLPSIFTTTVGIGYIVYQFFAFKTSHLFSDGETSFFYEVSMFIWEFISTHVSLTIPLGITALICSAFYLFYPTLAQASAIQAIARKKNKQPSGAGIGLRYGILSFLPLFEYHLLIKTFAFFSILIQMSFVVRNLGVGIFQMLLPVFIILVVISLILTLLFTYTDFFIVIDDVSVFQAMKESAKLVMTHWKYTFFITLLMILIGIRIIIQLIIVLMVPFLVVLATGYIATVALPITSLIIGGVLGFVFLILSAYINGVLDIFSYTVWTYTFLEITSEKELSAREIFVDEIGETKSPAPPEHKNL